MKKVTVLGATGSIGVSTLDVLSRHPERYSVYALTAHNNIDALARQCEIFRPNIAVVRNAEDAHTVEKLLRDKNVRTEVIYGKDALSQVASSPDCDIVVSGIVGAAGLLPSLAAAKAGKKILLANKESLVISGRIFIDAVNESGATLLPIDSEHNAIFQCLPDNYAREPRSFGVAKVILTASGGPFLTRPIETLNSVTPKEAVSHPKWSMGRKISVDSATMMNKGLEVIEAHWLFGVPSEKIEVVIHPQSVIHSMVAYIDGAIIAQLGHPDMRTPIAQALAYPERIDSGVSPLDLTRSEALHFTAPNYARFPCLKLAYDALDAGGAYPAVLNAVNEVAVEAFLDGKIGFRAIENLIQETMNKISLDSAQMSIEFLLEQDERARALAKELMHYF